MEEKYKTLVEMVLNDCGINAIDQEIENANLFFGTSKHYKKGQLNSNYVRILNIFDMSTLSEEEINQMNTINSLEEGKDFIKKTINKVTGRNYLKEPLKKILKNTFVLEILVGKNTKELRGQEFIDNMKQQKEFLIGLERKYTRLLTRALNYPVIFYHDKDL